MRHCDGNWGLGDLYDYLADTFLYNHPSKRTSNYEPDGPKFFQKVSGLPAEEQQKLRDIICALSSSNDMMHNFFWDRSKSPILGDWCPTNPMGPVEMQILEADY